jgi:hypothetical protein
MRLLNQIGGTLEIYTVVDIMTIMRSGIVAIGGLITNRLMLVLIAYCGAIRGRRHQAYIPWLSKSEFSMTEALMRGSSYIRTPFSDMTIEDLKKYA